MSWSMQTCGSCGAEAQPTNQFCETCGQFLRGATSPSRTPVPPPTGEQSMIAPEPGDVAAVLRLRGPTEPAMLALAQLRDFVTAAGLIAVAMIIVGLLLLHSGVNLLVPWLLAGVFVIWRSFVSIPAEIRHCQYHEARHKLIAPAVMNILFIGIVPGLLLFVAYFRSRILEDAPPFHLERR